jgi:hypothetical protein
MRSPFTIESDTQIASESGEWEEALGTESVFEAADDPELSFEEEFEIEDTAALRAGREEIPRVQLLSGHRATGPALILSWNDMPAGVRAVDVVVHLHGYALCPADQSNPWPKITSGGLDWRDPKGSDRSLGRVRPTLGILPRGHLFGGKTGAGFRFPALVTKTGLRQLIDLGLARLASRLSVASLAQGRLILTAHSGGGAALLGMLRYNDPQEVHIFDGLYQDPAMLIRWAKSRIARDQNALTAAAQTVESYMANHGGALRVLYRPGTATEGFSRAVERALAAVIPSRSELRKWYRVERTSVSHCLIPRTYGWRFLADARSFTNGAATSPRSLGREEFDPEEKAATCRFGFTPRAVESSGGGRVTVKTPPPRVVNVPGVYRPIPLHPLAAEAWKALVAAARAAGHRHPLLLPTSGFRDPQRQRKLWERALVKYRSAKEARKWVAPPGGSAHQSGRAIDFYLGGQNSSSNVSTLRGLPAYRWLAQNAICFGFYPYEREPWHWEYNPPAGGGGETNPELETSEEFEWEEESWASQYPPDVRQAIAMGGAVWPLALQRAIKSGIRDSIKLANIAFFMHHPERDGRPISANEPGAGDLIALWKFFRDEAKKMLSPAVPASTPASSGSCRTTIPQVNTLMPESAPGLEAKKPESHRFGLPETIAALTEIGRRWQAAHPSGPLVRIRDISRCGGGKFPPHDSHRMGIDVDIGLMRNDGRTAAVNHRMQPSKYSQELTQEMVDTIRANGLLGVHRIWFSDKGVRNVTHDTSHNDHVHVRFCLPAHYDLAAMKQAAFTGGTRGTFAACTS